MVFSSFTFLLIFFPCTVLGYYLINPKFKNIFLLMTSIIFYTWGEPKFILVMLLSILVNYLLGLAVDKFREYYNISIVILLLMIVWNVGIFFIYKYLDFAITNINTVFRSNIPLYKISLPIGISFFTFQAMSYVIDVYRGNGQVQKNPLNVALYLTFFPQLIAGPIVRYETIAKEINNRCETLQDFTDGLKRFIIGIGKKCIISNTVAILADSAFETQTISLTVMLAWAGAISYTLQIYFDFSGYSDMAIGLGKMFGFHFNENFNYPYCSSSISEFWRRWHISLGSWFRDYVYIPLGGSRVKTKFRLIFNLFITWMLTGIWHGASWNFILWGFMYFILLTFEKLTQITKRLIYTWQKVLYRIFTLLCVIVGWVIFRTTSLSTAFYYLAAMFGLNKNKLASNINMNLISQYIIIGIVGMILCVPLGKKLKSKIQTNTSTFIFDIVSKVFLLAILICSMAFIAGSKYDPFIYFNF